jgi:hydrogenase maturation protein HypF
VLAEETAAALRRKGLRPLLPRALPPNDGGIALGQAAVAAARG